MCCAGKDVNHGAIASTNVGKCAVIACLKEDFLNSEVVGQLKG
jgi:hypothetical protein